MKYLNPWPEKILFFSLVLIAYLKLSACSVIQNWMAGPLEVGKEYEVIITQDLGFAIIHSPYGFTEVGGVLVAIPSAKAGERYKIKVTDIRENANTGKSQASCEFMSMSGMKKGKCIAPP